MTQEEKQLLLKDLCGRVPYITFVYIEWHVTEELVICEGYEDDEPNIHTLIACYYYGECDLDDNLYKTIYDIKPYLRPMSSMTEEEDKIYIDLLIKHWHYECIDWLNEHHFDYRGLIGMGLALPAPDGMYNL